LLMKKEKINARACLKTHIFQLHQMFILKNSFAKRITPEEKSLKSFPIT